MDLNGCSFIWPLSDDVGSHLAQRSYDTINRSAGKTCAPDQTTVKTLASKQSGEQAHRRGRVSAIDVARGRRQHTPLSVNDEHVWLRMFNFDPEEAQCLHCAHTIVARQKSAQNTHAIGKRGNNSCTVRDTLV